MWQENNNSEYLSDFEEDINIITKHAKEEQLSTTVCCLWA
jgi:hypothetical protein